MGSVTEWSTEIAWKLNNGCWNPPATRTIVPFVMLTRTILIPNLDCFDGERNALQSSLLIFDRFTPAWHWLYLYMGILRAVTGVFSYHLIAGEFDFC